MSYLNYLIEKDEILYNEQPEVNEIKINDSLPTSDEIVKDYNIKSPILNIYGRGERFEIHDNQDLYQIAKYFKDFIDKHFYYNNFKYFINVSYRSLSVKIVQDTNNIGLGDIMDYQMDNIINFIKLTINRNYQEKYDISTSTKKLPNGIIETNIIIKHK